MQNDNTKACIALYWLRQGDALLTLLFNVALEGAMRLANVKNPYKKSKADADDIDIVKGEQRQVYMRHREKMRQKWDLQSTRRRPSSR